MYEQAITKTSVGPCLSSARTLGIYLKKKIFFFQKGLPTLIPRGHFHFLHFIYFQTEFSVFSYSYDASSYIQIESLRKLNDA